MRTYQTRTTVRLQRKAMLSGAMAMLGLVCSWMIMATCGYLYAVSLCV